MSGFVDFGDVDPAVSALLGEQKKRGEEKRLSPRERRRKARERGRAKRRLAGRVNWDLPPALKARLNAIAEEEGVPVSQLATALLIEGLKRLQSGELSLRKVYSDSPRFRFVLELPDVPQ